MENADLSCQADLLACCVFPSAMYTGKLGNIAYLINLAASSTLPALYICHGEKDALTLLLVGRKWMSFTNMLFVKLPQTVLLVQVSVQN